MSAIEEYLPSDAEIDSYARNGGREVMQLPTGSNLPAIVDAFDFTETDIPEPPQIVSGILHQGSKMVLGGGSKSFKTWQLLDLAISVSHGLDWLQFQTSRCRVLYVNFEIQNYAWQKRVRTVAEARNIKMEKGSLDFLNLRGHASDYKSLLPAISALSKDAAYGLMLLDPAYKLYGTADENAASDIAGLLNAVETLAVETGAAVAFGAHFSKGNQSQKEAIDRISGSGVFARDPDSLLTLTRHEEEGAFTVDAILRNFAPIQPFVVRWEFPLMRPDESLNPDNLKTAPGKKTFHTPDKMMEVLKGHTYTTAQWKKAAADEKGIPKTQFYTLLSFLESEKRIVKLVSSDQWTTA
jgi:hypothetical protein